MALLRTRFMAYGFLLGTAGLKILTSKDAKKVYTHVTAAALRGVDDAVRVYTEVKENCEDILADAKEINEKRIAEESNQIIEDQCDAE